MYGSACVDDGDRTQLVIEFMTPLATTKMMTTMMARAGMTT
jgi:hypothetical protein